jgi:hypothetical protein
MARRFGRNQRRKMRTEVESLAFALRAEKHFRAKVDGELREIRSKLATVLRDQLAKGVVPLEVEHFLSRDQHNVIMHAIFDERRSNLHYQHQISPSDLIIPFIPLTHLDDACDAGTTFCGGRDLYRAGAQARTFLSDYREQREHFASPC